MRRALLLLLVATVVASASAANLRPVTFRYANVNCQALIGLPNGARKTIVLPDGSLHYHDQWLSFALADGGLFGKGVPVKQSLVDGYLPMVRTEATIRGAKLSLTAFAAELPRVGACDVVEVAADAPDTHGALPLGVAAKFSAQTYYGVRGEGKAGFSLHSSDRASGHVGDYGGAGVYWGSPGAGFDAGFSNLCIGWNGRPMSYRLKVTPGHDYTVALGFWENYWHEKGHRLVQVDIEGRKIDTFDTFVRGGNKPFVVEYPARDLNGDGVLDVSVRSAPGAADNNSVLNVLWLFEGSQPRPTKAVVSGSLNRDAIYHIDCGGPSDLPFSEQSIRMSFPLNLAGRHSVFLVRPWNLAAVKPADLPRRLGPQLLADVASRWNDWLARAAQITVPQRVVSDFYKAALIDIMLMRDRTPEGYDIPQPGATVYRGFWMRDGSYIINALASAGLFHEARQSLAYLCTTQDPDGAWDRPRTQWDSLGQAPWAITTVCALSHDNVLLAKLYPKLLAGVRWTAASRKKSKVLGPDGKRSLTWGLVQPGFGDGGLPTAYVLGQDFWALYGEDLTIAAARKLGRTADLPALEAERTDFASCIRDCMKRCFIKLPGGGGYLPPIPGDRQHWSEWGNLGALYPSGIFLKDPLMMDTLRHIDSRMKEGLPLGLGYTHDGVWPYMACDVAKIYLRLDEADKAANMFYAILDHAAPTRDWIEEIALPSHMGAGDMPHGWASANYILLLRDLLAFEDHGSLQVAAGVPRDWLQDGLTVGVRDLPTTFGPLTYTLTSHVARGEMSAEVTAPAGVRVVFHFRHPRHLAVRSVTVDGHPAQLTGDAASFTATGSSQHLVASFGH